MIVLHVIGSVDPRNGGTTSYVFSISRVWSRYGHTSHVLTLDDPNSPHVAESQLVTIAKGNKRNSELGRYFPLLRYGYTPALARWLNANAGRYDAVIIHGIWNYTSYGTWRALRKRKVPYFVFPHGMLDPWLMRTHPQKQALRLLFWCLAERKVVRDAAGVIFACEEERRLARQLYIRRPDIGTVMGFGIEDIGGESEQQRAAFFAKFPQLVGRKFAIFLGRIHPKKGLDMLVTAFSQIASEHVEFDLVIAGPGDTNLMTQLARLSARLGLERRVHWTGMIVGDEKLGGVRASQFFVLPSHQENFGIAVVEALAAGVPVLLTKKVNIWGEIVDYRAGFAVDATIDDLTIGLRRMLGSSGAALRQMSANARRCFVERFDLEKNAAELAAVISRTAAARCATPSGDG